MCPQGMYISTMLDDAKLLSKIIASGNSLVVQWLVLGAFTAEGPDSIPSQGTKIPQAAWRGQKKNKRKEKNHCIQVYCPPKKEHASL